MIGPVGTGVDAGDRILCKQSTGQLLYHVDGNGAGAAVQFAVLAGSPIIGQTDFLVS